MGQIVGGAAKPKRCNLNKLSQLGTPAAGEHILVSSDNSMNAAGQGNFDAYVVGNGRDAATALELKKIGDFYLINDENDFSISDKNGYDIVQFKNGHIRTKKFNSEELDVNNIPFSEDSNDSTDFSIADEEGYDILRLAEGHIRTKKFNSEELPSASDFEKILSDKYAPSVNIFDHLFSTGMDTSDFGHIGGTLAQEYITLGAGQYILRNKTFVFNDEKICVRLTASSTSKIILLSSTSPNSLSNSDLCSFVAIDFSNGQIDIAQSGTFSTNDYSYTTLESTTFGGGAGDYVVTFGRKERAPFVNVYNCQTTESSEIYINEASYNIDIAKRPAGWLYYYQGILCVTGSVNIKRMTGSTKKNVSFLFVGDSYTQGYGVNYNQSWVSIVSENIPNTLNAAISGSVLTTSVAQYKQSIKGKINCEYAVLTIGINDAWQNNDVDTFINNYRAFLEELVEDGIQPIVNIIWDNTDADAISMMSKLKELGYIGCDFSAVSGCPSNPVYYAHSHLNVAGNLLSAKIFTNELNNVFL